MSLIPPRKNPPQRNWRGFLTEELARAQAEWRTRNGDPHTTVDVLHEWALEDNATYDRACEKLLVDVLESVGLRPLARRNVST